MFYHNDDDYTDDDSLFSEQAGKFIHAFRREKITSKFVSIDAYDQDRGNSNINRTWDFDDNYCQPCTKDSKKNQNTWLNCKYSKDSIDIHWYTPWDSIYRYLYAKKSFSLPYFDKVAKNCASISVWSTDSLTMVRDTVLYYGKNKLGSSARDSVLFKSIVQKREIPRGQSGDGILDLPFAMQIYIGGGSKILIDKRDGSPQFQLNGPQFYNAPKDYRIITGPNDSCLFVYALEFHQDSLLADMVQPWHRVIKRVPVAGYLAGDSINPALHRQLFYDRVPMCFNMLLSLKDTVHPFKCESRKGTYLALLPPSAKRLRIDDHFCYGYGNKVINFKLDDTKPGCVSSFVKFNPDYIHKPDQWLLVNDLYYGDVMMGTFNAPEKKYPGYAADGPNVNRFFWLFNDSNTTGRNPQSVNVALIIGNGVDPGYCLDTVYYPNFATFPKLDASIVFAGSNSTLAHMCTDTFIYVTAPNTNSSDKLLADGSGWLMVNGLGDTTEMILEYYFRVKDNPRYPGKKVNYTVIERYRLDKGLQKLYRTDTLFTAIVHAWNTVALPGVGFSKLRRDLANIGMNIDDFKDTEVMDLIWNRVGTKGIPSTGSKGCIDTTGYGHELDYYQQVTSSTMLHYRDTSLLPADSTLINGKMYKTYAFRPDRKGTYNIYRSVMSYFPTYCPLEDRVDLVVGFYAKVTFADSIICRGQVLEAVPFFRYYDVNPNTFGMIDSTDYWYLRRNLAGQDDVEGYTIWDFNKDDDSKAKPSTIFGSMPYAKRGYPKPSMLLGNEPGGIYYHQPGLYKLRIATSDSNGCVDTLSQNIYVTGPKAGFYLDQVKPECNTIIELFDTSYIIDPCVKRGLDPCDFIYKWTIKWGDGSEVEYLKATPKQIGHDYGINGHYRIVLIIESVLGCRDTVFHDLFIPGPLPSFVPETKLVICVNDSVKFRNTTQAFGISSQWIWNFGDGFYTPAFDTSSIYHQYKQTGRFDVYLTQYDRLDTTGKYCGATFPNTSKGQLKVTVEVLPYDIVKIAADPIVVCVGDTIDVTAALSTKNAYLHYNWSFDGKPFVTTGLKLRVAPSRRGRFDITWAADTIGLHKQFCPDFDTVTVFADSVLADFSIDPSQEPVFCFTNLSKYANTYRWGFFHDTDITFRKKEFLTDEKQKEPERHICRNFIDHPGTSWVCLEAENSMGCKDTVCKKVLNNYEMAILPPNVFTPNGNDGFNGQDKEGLPGNNVFNVYTKNVEFYHIIIYDRWGVQVFESFETQYDWNGSVNNKGAKCPDGTYYYILDYSYRGRDKHEPLINGVVQLIW